MYQKKCYRDKHVHLLLIGEKDKMHYVLIKDFNAFMYDNTLHRGKTFLSLLFTSFQYRRKYQNVIY